MRFVLCDELENVWFLWELVGLVGFHIHGWPESRNPACCQSWFGCKSFSWMLQKSSLKGSVNAPPFSHTISWNVFPRANISRSAMRHLFHSLNTPNRSVPVGAYAGVAGPVSARSFATNKNTSQNSSMNVHV